MITAWFGISEVPITAVWYSPMLLILLTLFLCTVVNMLSLECILSVHNTLYYTNENCIALL